MAARAAFLVLPASLLLAVPAVFGQAPAPPPEVDQALRSRVTEFFQDFVDGKYRAALDLVAEDTQDLYFSSSKWKVQAFSIEGVEYAPDFTKAAVSLKVKRLINMKAEGFFKEIPVDTPMTVEWKIEKGKWVWTQSADKNWATPMGGKASNVAASAPKVPDNIDDTKARQEATRILSNTATQLSGNAVTLNLDEPSSAKLVFHNGLTGSVEISVAGFPAALPGLTAKLENREVDAGKDATIEFVYDPSQKPLVTPVPNKLQVEVNVAPFDQAFPVLLTLTSSN